LLSEKGNLISSHTNVEVPGPNVEHRYTNVLPANGKRGLLDGIAEDWEANFELTNRNEELRKRNMYDN
jgi:hypothetical protein